MNRKRFVIILLIICLLVILWLLYMFWVDGIIFQRNKIEKKYVDIRRDTESITETVESTASTEEFTYIDDDTDYVMDESLPETIETEQTETEAVTAEQTLDFESLIDINADIYSWIEIKNSIVDYPVLQNSNDKKYLKTGADGKKYIGGALFTESKYNSKDFDDPVTIIYGHTMRSGILFGSLEKMYSSAENMSKYSDIKIYLENDVLHYTVFAAVPYSKTHLLKTYDFSDNYVKRIFIEEITSTRALNAVINKDIAIEDDDKILILSTCMSGNASNRFLVLAVRNDD